MSKTKAFFFTLWRYGRTYWRSALFCLLLPAIFVLLHLLAGGLFQEIAYALLMISVLLALAFWVTLIRFFHRQAELWQAQQNLPPEPDRLPLAQTPMEEDFRGFAIAFGNQARQHANEARRMEAERRDYYTLWVHQIKTPIAALNLMAQSQQPIQREHLLQELYKIEQYAEAALSYQRLHSMHEDLLLCRVPLYPLCCQVVKKLRPLFVYGKTRLVMEPFACNVLTDAKWLSLVLEQVLTNALKYQPEGRCVTIALPQAECLTIADEGIGIRAEDVPRVFDRGFTGFVGHNHEKSSGIGLYLSKKVCDGLGHRISLVSRQGEGTIVTLDMRREVYEDF